MTQKRESTNPSIPAFSLTVDCGKRLRRIIARQAGILVVMIFNGADACLCQMIEKILNLLADFRGFAL